VASRTITSPLPIDLPRSVGSIRAGAGDPSVRTGPATAVVATRTPEGPGTIEFSGAGTTITAEAWGPGSGWLLDHAPAMCGAADDLTGFAPQHRIIDQLARTYPGMRVIRTGAVVEMMLRVIVGQKVTGKEAKDGYRRMVLALGEPAPGHPDLLLPPNPEVVAGLAYHAFHPWGIERKRAETILRVARRRGRLAETAQMPRNDAYRRLNAVPGIGPWTTGIVAGTALGDPDAVAVGDYNIPHMVSWLLAGEPRSSDDRMLELLEPYRGHRGRVVRLLKASGVKAPRYGPRLPAREIRGS